MFVENQANDFRHRFANRSRDEFDTIQPISGPSVLPHVDGTVFAAGPQ